MSVLQEKKRPKMPAKRPSRSSRILNSNSHALPLCLTQHRHNVPSILSNRSKFVPTYAEVLAALPDFRNDLLRRQHLEGFASITAEAFATRGAFAAFATPTGNIHATGIGIRSTGGRYFPDDHVLKLFVFDKLPPGTAGIPDKQSW